MGTRIRRFNESKSMLDTNNINDILLDLKDLGHTWYIRPLIWSNDAPNFIEVCIYGSKNKDEIIEYVERLNNYLKSEGFEPLPITTKEIEKIKKGEIEEHFNITFEWKQEKI